MRGIAPVARDAGRSLNVLARERVSVPTAAAVAAGTAVPADPDTRADLPTIDIRTDRIDSPEHRVPRNARVHESRHMALHDQRVAVTDAAGVHANSNLVAPGLGHRALLHAESTARLCNDHRAHCWHGSLLGCLGTSFTLRGRPVKQTACWAVLTPAAHEPNCKLSATNLSQPSDSFPARPTDLPVNNCRQRWRSYPM